MINSYLRASQRVWSFDLGLLVLVPQYSTEHPMRHTVSVLLVIELCWSTRHALATIGNLGSPNVSFTAGISVP
jgi:hypothetical protein